jgi:hypothetical protein
MLYKNSLNNNIYNDKHIIVNSIATKQTVYLRQAGARFFLAPHIVADLISRDSKDVEINSYKYATEYLTINSTRQYSSQFTLLPTHSALNGVNQRIGFWLAASGLFTIISTGFCLRLFINNFRTVTILQ